MNVTYPPDHLVQALIAGKQCDVLSQSRQKACQALEKGADVRQNLVAILGTLEINVSCFCSWLCSCEGNRPLEYLVTGFEKMGNRLGLVE